MIVSGMVTDVGVGSTSIEITLDKYVVCIEFETSPPGPAKGDNVSVRTGGSGIGLRHGDGAPGIIPDPVYGGPPTQIDLGSRSIEK